MDGPAPPEPVGYLCGVSLNQICKNEIGYCCDCWKCQYCGAENTLKPGDVIQCRECGYRILYKKRTRRSCGTDDFRLSMPPYVGLIYAVKITLDLHKASSVSVGEIENGSYVLPTTIRPQSCG
eukprot:Gb_10543 [translate_table: standard]